jgi:cytochrome c oxidase assembly factor CtaG
MTDSLMLAVTWWCQTTQLPWDWTPRYYPGVWVLVALFVIPYVIAVRHRSRTVGLDATDKRAAVWFALGVLAMWSASDWPLGTLGAGYLLSVHTVLYLIYTMIAAPLILLGLRPWLAESILRRTHGWAVYRQLRRPWVAVVILNAILVITHIPLVVDTLRVSQFGSFVLDALWLISGLCGWLPIITPFKADRIRTAIWQCVYLFLAFGAFPMLPGAFITFAGLPLYRVYDLAPRFEGWTPLEDQQLAGALMKVGNIPILWAVIGVLFMRTALENLRRDSSDAPVDDNESVST